MTKIKSRSFTSQKTKQNITVYQNVLLSKALLLAPKHQLMKQSKKYSDALQ